MQSEYAPHTSEPQPRESSVLIPSLSSYCFLCDLTELHTAAKPPYSCIASHTPLACREVSSIIRDNARSGGGEGAHVLLGGGGLAFLGLESSKEEALTALEKAQNRQGVGRLVLRAAHTTISHIFLVICRPAKNQPSLSQSWNLFSNASCNVWGVVEYTDIWVEVGR